MSEVPDLSDLSASDLARRVAHQIRQPLRRIADQTEAMMIPPNKLNPTQLAGLALIYAETRRTLDMYDWVLLLFEAALLSPQYEINTYESIKTIALEFEAASSSGLIDYRLIWHVSAKLPYVTGSRYLLERTLRLMIRLLGSLGSPYVQLGVEDGDKNLAIHVSTAAPTDMPTMPATLERTIFEAVARVCRGQFEWTPSDQTLKLVLHLQKVKVRQPRQRKQKETA